MGGDRLIQSEGDGARLSFPPAFWVSSAGTTLSTLLPAWMERGWLSAPPESDYPSTLSLARKLWRDLGQPSDIEDAAGESALLTELLDIRAARYRIVSGSFLSGRRFQLTLTRNGTAIPPGSEVCVGEPPEQLWLPPPVVVIRELLAESASTEGAGRFALVHRLQEVSRYSSTVGVSIELDDHLAGLDIVAPRKLKLGWEASPRNPSLFNLGFTAELPDGTQEPLRPEQVDPTAPIASLGGRRYLLLEEDAATSARHAGARQQSRSRREVAAVIQDPAAALPPGTSSETIDLSEYSSRVAGFERVVRAARPQDIQSSGVRWFEDEPAQDGAFLSLDIASPDPAVGSQTLVFQTPEETVSARDRLAGELGRPAPAIVPMGGKEVWPTEALFHRLDVELAIHRREQTRVAALEEPVRAPPRLAAVIREEVALHGESLEGLERNVPWSALDAALVPPFTLKAHQRGGVAWLWYHLTHGTPGVLLADDMGLGKTLQVASLLALQRARTDTERPSLIVAPIILLENWLAELEKFFRPGTFGRVQVLHGDGLEQCRKGAGLDLDLLRSRDLVVTNYDTLARFQLDLLKMDWETVVLDEGHAIKNADTLRARAASGLKRRFAICLTGTPVENRLADLWSLYFFLSPHRPFGRRSEFISDYEGDTEGARKVRSALSYPSAQSSLLRRTKSEVAALPPKSEHVHRIEMTAAQRELERRLVASARGSTGGALGVLAQLQKLYQHPWLLRENVFGSSGRMPSADAACADSPKLAACLHVLDEVRERREKALVFTRWMQMQTLLAHVIRERFGLRRVLIINGETNQKRQALAHIRDFESTPGFDVLVLSPLAAGVGLNIVAANHVIHYDRWWNPAKEDQATDRAYRIGQEKPVFVHYPLLHHPGDPEAGFDVKLHDLVSSKRRLATDFLAPGEAQAITAEQLLSMFDEAEA